MWKVEVLCNRRILSALVIVAALFLGLVSTMDHVAGSRVSTEEVVMDQSSDRLRYIVMGDGYSGQEENYGVTPAPEHQPLEVRKSDDPQFEYMASTPSYTVYFKETTVRMKVKDAWIEFELGKQKWGEAKKDKYKVEGNKFSLQDVYEAVDLSYKVESSLLTEVLIVKNQGQFDRIIQRISWEGVTPVYEEDGSIVFSEGDTTLVKMLPPFMRDAIGNVCTDLHYEVAETETGYELHKIVDEKGLEWLKSAVFPVVVDPTMQTIEDAWKGSGLQPYGQYFVNLKEFVNPVNGHLAVVQTDLTVPGRGLDLAISRVYETPAVFHWGNPYEYESPPVDVGKGWQLDFPYIGTKFVHLWGGALYRIQWTGNQFENHVGTHFILVKNGDNTYTLTMADGTVYEFSTAGKLTQIKDVDLNTITFNYTNGVLTSITDTIGRVVTLSYSNNRLWKIIYNNGEIEYSYDSNGCLVWTEDLLNRRTSYYYNSGFNVWLLSKVVYPATGYTTYVYNRFIDSGGYYKYYVTDQRVYETNQVRHSVFTYTGSFIEVTASAVTVKNESDITQGFYSFTIANDLITEAIMKNAQGAALRKITCTYSSRNEILQKSMYNNGTTLSYTVYYAYDSWGNVIYFKNASGHEQFFSYANTSTSGYFVDNTNTVIQRFTNAFFNDPVPSAVHNVLLGAAEKQDNTFVREMYLSYDSEAHSLQSKRLFGNATTYLTFSGTFNEKTGSTSFPIDLAGHTVAGNAVLQITGLPSDDTYQETHVFTCPCYSCSSVSGTWSGNYFRLTYRCNDPEGGYTTNTTSIGPFTNYPGSPGYESFTTTPRIGYGFVTFSVTTTFRAYPAQVQYNLDGGAWKTITTKLQNTTSGIYVPITTGTHTLNFSESSSYSTKFSWNLYVPVDNTPESYITSMAYDTYGNVTSITDAESNTVMFSYSSEYSCAYLTEISTTVGNDVIGVKATYDYYRGWITSIQEPKGVATSGFDTLYTYDLLGRVTKGEFPLLPGQSQRTSVEAVYDDANRTVTLIDQLRHYTVRHYDGLGRLAAIKEYTGVYGSGTLYATMSYTYAYNGRISTVTDMGNNTYSITSDFLGRYTYLQYPNSASLSCSYDDTNNTATLTTGRGYRKIFWYDWLFQVSKVEEEYQTDLFATTSYQYDEIGQLVSLTDAENRTTGFIYASLFGLTKKVYPDSTYEEYMYDNTGNVTSFIGCKGNETAFTYDSLHRLTQIQYSDQSTVSFFFDLNSNMVRMNDNATQAGDYEEYFYDSWNRLTGMTRHVSQGSHAVSYEYDAANRLTTLTYPDGMEILYAYDDLSRMTEIRRYVDGSNDEILMDNIQYTTENLITQFDYGNGLRAFFSYDSKDRLLTFDVRDGETSYLDLDFAWDSNSNITQVVNGWRDTDFDWHSDTESYSYDGLDRLVSASCGSWSHTYSYDKAGNRTSADSVTYTINALNQITALSDGTSFTYDLNGNRTEKTQGTDTWVYTYDSANRLINVEKNSTTLGEYVYDGSGRRIQETEDSVTTTCIYSGLGVVYEENTIGTATYIYGPTGRIAKRTTINGESTTFYYHTDQIGSTRLVTDGSKNIVSSATYHPFGEPHSEEGDENFLFVGKEKDSTGLYYFGARYYDCETGTFITRDSAAGAILSPQSFNQYAYCQNNPLKYVDPWGLQGRRPAWQGVDKDPPSEQEPEPPKGSLFSVDSQFWLHQDLPYKDGWIFLLTPVCQQGNVGTAWGYYATLNTSSQTQRVYDNNGYGLVVFIFDDEGNLVAYYFIPAEDLQDPDRAWEWRCFLRSEFSKYGVSMDDFRAAMDELRQYCDLQSHLEGGASTVGGSAGGVCVGLLITGPVGWIGGAVFALVCFLTADFWDSVEDMLANFSSLMSSEKKPGGGGGGGF